MGIFSQIIRQKSRILVVFILIFATVGTSKHDFSRTVKTIDELSKKVEEMVLIQIGHSKHIPQNAMYVKFLNPVDFEKTIKKARVVIISGGSSSLFKCVDNGKKPIIFPRLKKYEIGRAHV